MDARRPSALLQPLAVAVAIGIALRLAFGLVYWNDKPLTRDEQEYLSLARSLAAGHGFVYDPILSEASIEPFGRAPGYPAFLAAIGAGRAPVSSVTVVVDVAQAFVGAIGIVFVALLTRVVAGNTAAVWSARIAAVYPPLVWVAGYAMSEALFWPMALAAVWLLETTRRSPRPFRWALATGAVVGLSILVRPGHVLFVPFALLALNGLRLPRNRGTLTATAATAAAFLLGIILVVGPWTARNVVHHGRFLFVASDGGVTFWTGNHPLAIGEGDMAANPVLKLDNHRLRAEHPGLTEEELEPIFYREALAWIRSNPGRWIGLEFRKLFYTFVPVGPSYTLHSPRYLLLSLASYGAVALLALVALIRTRGWSTIPGLWALAASSVLTALIFFPQERFRIPIIDPTLVILAGAAVASFAPRARRS